MRTSEVGLSLIKRFEGFSATTYLDVAGFATIGYGHLIRQGEEFTHLAELEAELLLKNDVAVAEKAVARLIHAKLNQLQFDALVSFAFNLGAGALQRSTLRAKVNRAEHEEIPFEFNKWVWAGGRKSLGLIRRRAAEGQLYAAMR